MSHKNSRVCITARVRSSRVVIIASLMIWFIRGFGLYDRDFCAPSAVHKLVNVLLHPFEHSPYRVLNI